MGRQNVIARSPSVKTTHPVSPWVGLSRKENFYEDSSMKDMLRRATEYVHAGVSINLSGAAGLGKTTFALRVAEEIGRPVSFMTGNQWLTTRDFVGREVGQLERTVVDKYVQSVRRTETETKADWKSAILAVSMIKGYTLVYDEFTRASPEANSSLLSVLEEGVLVSTDRASERSYIKAHDDFRIILTSNPHDYAGVQDAPDALMDRMVTLHMREPSIEQLSGIVSSRTGLDKQTARLVADIVHSSYTTSQGHTVSPLRTSLQIARIAAHKIRKGRLLQDEFVQIIQDVLGGRGAKIDTESISLAWNAPLKKGAAA